jgi:hypothetical protein
MFRSSRDLTNKYHLVLLESLAILNWCKHLWLLKNSLPGNLPKTQCVRDALQTIFSGRIDIFYPQNLR